MEGFDKYAPSSKTGPHIWRSRRYRIFHSSTNPQKSVLRYTNMPLLALTRWSSALSYYQMAPPPQPRPGAAVSLSQPLALPTTATLSYPTAVSTLATRNQKLTFSELAVKCMTKRPRISIVRTSSVSKRFCGAQVFDPHWSTKPRTRNQHCPWLVLGWPSPGSVDRDEYYPQRSKSAALGIHHGRFEQPLLH